MKRWRCIASSMRATTTCARPRLAFACYVPSTSCLRLRGKLSYPFAPSRPNERKITLSETYNINRTVASVPVSIKTERCTHLTLQIEQFRTSKIGAQQNEKSTNRNEPKKQQLVHKNLVWLSERERVADDGKKRRNGGTRGVKGVVYTASGG